MLLYCNIALISQDCIVPWRPNLKQMSLLSHLFTCSCSKNPNWQKSVSSQIVSMWDTDLISGWTSVNLSRSQHWLLLITAAESAVSDGFSR